MVSTILLPLSTIKRTSLTAERIQLITANQKNTQTLQKPTVSVEIKSFATTQNFTVFSDIKVIELLHTPQGQSLRCVNT